MAEPVFDEHPLAEYFSQTGELAESMPGTIPEFVMETEPCVRRHWAVARIARWAHYLRPAFAVMDSMLPSTRAAKTEESFSERFKYDVISSSLLSTAIAASTTPSRRTFDTPDPPQTEEAEAPPDPYSITVRGLVRELALQQLNRLSAASGLPIPMLLASFSIVFFASGFFLFALVFLAGAFYTHRTGDYTLRKSEALTLTSQALSELISSGNTWDSAVNEAITILEREEQSIFYGPTSPRAPSSSLRVTLQSSLHTTQHQCDNVRHLLSALTEPSQLTQLAEMYAPSSPMQSSLSLVDNPRPVSAPGRHKLVASISSNKRATWNGSYSSLARVGSPTPAMRHRRLQKSEILLSAEQTEDKPSFSAPVTPLPITTNPLLQNVQEEDDATPPELPDIPKQEYFGAAAMELRRKRRTSAMDLFGTLPPNYLARPMPLSPTGDRTGHLRTGSSRLSPVHTTRHPLSLSGLHLALHGALSAKRYACSHLLALRFEDEDDDTYWEDVRSVMALLTSTFSDASARLLEALGDAAQKRMRDERPSPIVLPMHLRSVSGSTSASSQQHSRKQHLPARTMAEMVSFAPMPSQLARFGTHVDAIVSALNDARENLEQCIDTLRTDVMADTEFRRQADGGVETQQHPAFQAYDRLRKELGLALRECERGRERLLDIIAGPQERAQEDADDTPALGQDTGSDESDKVVPLSPAGGAADLPGEAAGLGLDVGERVREDEDEDDATAHLLLTASSHHLPPAGVEQVFEADTGYGTAFARERSKLSREERIKLAKARRESAGVRSSLSESPTGPAVERWGPGGEVVQELKDVIWKVGERRRKMTEASASGAQDSAGGDVFTSATVSVSIGPHRTGDLSDQRTES